MEIDFRKLEDYMHDFLSGSVHKLRRARKNTHLIKPSPFPSNQSIPGKSQEIIWLYGKPINSRKIQWNYLATRKKIHDRSQKSLKKIQNNTHAVFCFNVNFNLQILIEKKTWIEVLFYFLHKIRE
jgi:hypothetical protein